MKQKLRDRICSWRKSLSQAIQLEAASSILGFIDNFSKLHNIAIYSAFNGELSLHLFQSKFPDKQFFLPKLEPRGFVKVGPLTTNKYGIKEPVAKDVVTANSLDVIFVPCVAFDREGNRLGLGAGFYDRVLANTKVIKVGVAYAEQEVEAIPVDSWDISLDYILTEKELINC